MCQVVHFNYESGRPWEIRIPDTSRSDPSRERDAGGWDSSGSPGAVPGGT